MATTPPRTLKTSAAIIAEIVAMAFPPPAAPGVTSMVHDLKVKRLRKPDATGCNWEADYKIGPNTFPAAITLAKALYNLSGAPSPVITTSRGSKIQR